MQNLLIWVVIGGLIGLAASYVLRTYANPDLRINIIVGIAGAVLTAFLVAPLLGFSAFIPKLFSYPAMMMAILGAMTLVPLVHLLRSGFPANARRE